MDFLLGFVYMLHTKNNNWFPISIPLPSPKPSNCLKLGKRRRAKEDNPNLFIRCAYKPLYFWLIGVS